MPKTRTTLDRDEKVTEILDATERRLRDGGYGAVSVAAIARELGLAHSAVYWYFPSKDHLLVSAFEHVVKKLLANKPKETRDVTERILWFVEQLGELYPIRASLHERAQTSKIVADYLDDFNERLRKMATNVLSPYIDAAEVDVAAASFTATVQGIFLAGIDAEERRRILTFALERLIGRDPV